jgi:hypothetical protein
MSEYNQLGIQQKKQWEEQWAEEEKTKAMISQSAAERFWAYFNFIIGKLDLTFLAGLFVFLSNVGGVLKDLLLKVSDYIFPIAAALKGLDLATYVAKFLNARNKNFGKLFDVIQKSIEFAAIVAAVVVAHYSLFSVTMFGVVVGGGVVMFGAVIAMGLVICLASTIGYAIAAAVVAKDNPAQMLKFEQKARTNFLFSALTACSLGVMTFAMMFPPVGIPLAIAVTAFTLVTVVFAVVVIACKDTPLGGKLYANIVEPLMNKITNFIENGLSPKKNPEQSKLLGHDSEDDGVLQTSTTGSNDNDHGNGQSNNKVLQIRQTGYFASLGAPKEANNLDNAIGVYQAQLQNQINASKESVKELYFWSENDKRRQKHDALNYVRDEVAQAVAGVGYTTDKRINEDPYILELVDPATNVKTSITFRTQDEGKQKVGDFVNQLYPKAGQSFFKDTARFDELYAEKLDQVFVGATKLARINMIMA